MPARGDGPPVVALPRRFDRRLRLGPFPSARDALKFLTYAAAGALLAPFVSAWLWVPLVGIGFLVAVWQPEGAPWDELLWRALVWRWRRRPGAGTVTPSVPPPVAADAFVRLDPGRHVAILRAEGIPLAYRPPADLEQLFAQYRAILRSLSGPVALRCTLAPLSVDPLLPPSRVPAPTVDQEARSGYVELVTLLCRRRSVRRVDLAVFGLAGGLENTQGLEGAVRALAGALGPLGIRTRRLRGLALAEAARAFGWPANGETG
jgi:hypothetical protein